MNRFKMLPNDKKVKTGRWQEKIQYSDQEKYTSIGRYRSGRKVGTWKTRTGNTLYEKEKFRGNVSHVTNYFPNGKVKEEGQTYLEIQKNFFHWYYFGDWKYYNPEGELVLIKRYHDGKMDSIVVKN